MTAVERAAAEQNKASRPDRSTWVIANAGSGKTRVLTDRVARLLLAGVAPQQILCLTYTKAAASEMQTRLYQRLGEWAMMDEPELRAALGKIGEDANALDSERLRHARTLFARALETPGGLKIRTIHAFCAYVLRRFPLEAGVSPQFREIEERDAEELAQSVLEELSTGTERAAFEAIAASVNDEAGLSGLVRQVLDNKSRLVDFDRNAAARALGISPNLTEAGVIEETMGEVGREMAALLLQFIDEQGSDTEKLKRTFNLKQIARTSNEETAIRHYEAFVYTADFAAERKSILNKSTLEKDPEFQARVEEFKRIIVEGRNRRLAVQTLNRTEALYDFAAAFLPAYEAKKKSVGALDFQDLIEITNRLISDSEAAQWVRYRIDGGVDHILVDESQDTSPLQWKIISTLESEFTDGTDDGREGRTLFVVGDQKQSIFGFQGADPNAFQEMYQHFAARLETASRPLQDVAMPTSFRSAAPILELVDRVFADDASEVLGQTSEHLALDWKPGRVDLWEFLENPPKEKEPPWFHPVDRISPENAIYDLARKVASFLKAELDKGRLIPGKSEDDAWRVLEPRDVRILLRSRGAFFEAVIAALMAEGVPVAGADRLRLTSVLAVRDIMSLLAFLDNDLDDLALAEALRSPLCGISEADLFHIAHGRDGSLWASLRFSQDHAEVVTMLRTLRDLTDFERPYELIETILTQFNGRHNLVARLGAETSDAIDALLMQALDFEQRHTPSLTQFITWMNTGDVTLKREMDASANEVRVTTVHGAKGLEAPLVIVPDVAKGRAETGSTIYNEGESPYLSALKSANNPDFISELRDEKAQKDANEAQRLLYVALTRAENWLIVCGAGSVTNKGTYSGRYWYPRVEDAMNGQSTQTHEFDGVPVRSRTNAHWKDAFGEATPQPPRTQQMPDWIRSLAPVYPEPEKPLSPSNLGGPHALPSELGQDPEAAMQRGRILHDLLEVLPATPPEQQAIRAAAVYRDAPDGPAFLAKALSLLADPGLRSIFTDDWLSEVPVAAYIPQLGQRILGRIDRLRITDQAIYVVDYKSNAEVPTKPEDIPLGILQQMGAYVSALKSIWPDRNVHISILWTQTGELMELSHAFVIGALDTVQKT